MKLYLCGFCDEAVFMWFLWLIYPFQFFWGFDGFPLILCRYDVAMFLTHRFLSSGEAVSLQTMTLFPSCIMIYQAVHFFTEYIDLLNPVNSLFTRHVGCRRMSTFPKNTLKSYTCM